MGTTTRQAAGTRRYHAGASTRLTPSGANGGNWPRRKRKRHGGGWKPMQTSGLARAPLRTGPALAGPHEGEELLTPPPHILPPSTTSCPLPSCTRGLTLLGRIGVSRLFIQNCKLQTVQS